MANQKAIIEKAWRAGHFFNPSKPDVFNVVSLEDALKLDVGHPIVQQALQSWQEADVNYETLYRSQRFAQLVSTKDSERIAEEWIGIQVPFDGELDPATETLTNLKRCGMPDHQPPAGVQFGFDDPLIQAAYESFQRFGSTGSGSWPAPGCDTELPESHRQYHSIVVQIDISNAPARFKDLAYQKPSIEACVNCYAEMGLLVRYDLEKKFAKPHIRKLFTALWGGVIGWNEFPQPGTCNQTINGRLDTGYVPADFRMWANLEVHETGHGVGEGHTRGGIMNPSIVLVWPLSWIGTPSERSLRRKFGGVRVPLPGRPVTWEDFLAV